MASASQKIVYPETEPFTGILEIDLVDRPVHKYEKNGYDLAMIITHSPFVLAELAKVKPEIRATIANNLRNAYQQQIRTRKFEPPLVPPRATLYHAIVFRDIFKMHEWPSQKCPENVRDPITLEERTIPKERQVKFRNFSIESGTYALECFDVMDLKRHIAESELRARAKGKQNVPIRDLTGNRILTADQISYVKQFPLSEQLEKEWVSTVQILERKYKEEREQEKREDVLLAERLQGDLDLEPMRDQYEDQLIERPRLDIGEEEAMEQQRLLRQYSENARRARERKEEEDFKRAIALSTQQMARIPAAAARAASAIPAAAAAMAVRVPAAAAAMAVRVPAAAAAMAVSVPAAALAAGPVRREPTQAELEAKWNRMDDDEYADQNDEGWDEESSSAARDGGSWDGLSSGKPVLLRDLF